MGSDHGSSDPDRARCELNDEWGYEQDPGT